jgi:chromosome segregation ATPase
MRRRSNSNSSFELFLDTICNIFGGIILIAILIAIQVRQTKETLESQESPSPQEMITLQQELVEVQTEFETASALLETVRKTMPEPRNENDRILLNQYNTLTEQRAKQLEKKGELISKHLAVSQQNVEMEQNIKDSEEQIKQLEAEEQKLSPAVMSEQSINRTLISSVTNLKNEIEESNRQIAAKTQKVEDKNDPTKNTREETLYLPKQHSSSGKQQFALVVRFNRLYITNDWVITISGERILGIPDSTKGIPLDGSVESEQKIKNLLNRYPAKQTYVLTIVYGDSADSFYYLRDIMIVGGFEYALRPSKDDEIWTLSGASGDSDVQ